MMETKQHRRGIGSLALQVSPCITLGLLLIASLSARAAGMPGQLPLALQQSTSAQASATAYGSAGDRDIMTLLGLDCGYGQCVLPLPLTSCCSPTLPPHTQHKASTSRYLGAIPRAP